MITFSLHHIRVGTHALCWRSHLRLLRIQPAEEIQRGTYTYHLEASVIKDGHISPATFAWWRQ